MAREVTEETGWTVRTGPILDAWMYYIAVVDKNVFIVTYGCYPEGDDEPVLSHEHNDIGLFSEHEVAGLPMPDGYQRSIATWFTMLAERVE
ncbi:NUDIX domain-containing protein [Amycolatopsis pigmentata]|uniref:NUDIX domain-containing protein n=1 Tax=Amycolatopsis pigmentata TaxID=450801 RepID=UPI00366B32E5